uniref:Kazal-like domain-containing protein n=1 Tax=Dracunculus medinensis TaxID=318479 RepID=A0A0N4U595_DRAME
LAAKEGRMLTIAPDEVCGINPCNKNCSTEYEPICSSNFITYPNRCVFEKAQCKQKNLELLYNAFISILGECRDCFSNSCPEPSENEPDLNFVCDQAGENKTKCEFEMLRCIYEKKFGYNITIAYVSTIFLEGRCCPAEEDCPTDFQPVCDSNGITHKNRCKFNVYQCRAKKILKMAVEFVKNWACDDKRPSIAKALIGILRSLYTLYFIYATKIFIFRNVS